MRVIVIILILVVLGLQYKLWFGDDGLTTAFQLKKDITALQEKNDEIKKKNESLVNEIESLKKGGVAIENRARSDLGMVKEGEIFYQVAK